MPEVPERIATVYRIYILAMCCDNLRSVIAISPEIAEAAGQVGNEAIRIGRDSEEGG